MRWLITLAYDGSVFHGWQIQPNGRTVQEDLERVLTGIAKHRIPIIGAGRTDAGVHAERQCAHFDLDTRMTPEQLVLAFQTQLARDIRILSAQRVPDNFSARFDARQRSYRYDIAREWTPFNRSYTSHFGRYRIDPDAFRECFPQFLGRHDFSSFAKHDNELENHFCTVSSLTLEESESLFHLRISADRFLHNMVRRIVGCLLTITNRGLEPDTIARIIELRRSTQNLVFTAPPQGLYLERVDYPESRLTLSLPSTIEGN